jgi:D-beta-D-heptose 7-phosphate kinase/D-beta-D-heptose 1-phosphate adenosyltransferase
MTKVFVNGTFDILHRGHLEMLKYARSLGDELMVCIDSDSRVRELKGEDRPINNQDDRKFMLDSLEYVTRCWIFSDEEELEKIIELYQPDVMVKGSDYRGKPIVGAAYCKEIKFYEHTGHSTTNIIKNITDR